MNQNEYRNFDDPTVALAVILNCRLSELQAVKAALDSVPGARVVYSRVGTPRSLWVKSEDERQPAEEEG